MIHLWCGFYVSQPLFDEAQLDGLQSVINRVLPDWSSGLCAARMRIRKKSPRSHQIAAFTSASATSHLRGEDLVT